VQSGTIPGIQEFVTLSEKSVMDLAKCSSIANRYQEVNIFSAPRSSKEYRDISAHDHVRGAGGKNVKDAAYKEVQIGKVTPFHDERCSPLYDIPRVGSVSRDNKGNSVSPMKTIMMHFAPGPTHENAGGVLA